MIYKEILIIKSINTIGFLEGVQFMWEIAFGVLCFGIILLNIGYCIFDREK
jgi:hypothetical protein